jgi:hypothetical protein
MGTKKITHKINNNSLSAFIEFWKYEPYIDMQMTVGRKLFKVSGIQGDVINWVEIPMSDHNSAQ